MSSGYGQIGRIGRLQAPEGDKVGAPTSTAGSGGDGLPPRERLLALGAIALAMTMAVLDGAIVNVVLRPVGPRIATRGGGSGLIHGVLGRVPLDKRRNPGSLRESNISA